MQYASFDIRCDVEIGDKVLLKHNEKKYIIDDIRTVHYLKSMEAKFEFALVDFSDDNTWINREDFIYPIVVKEV